MKKVMIIYLMAVSSLLGFGFTPPSGNTTVMVNQSDVLVAPTATELINANPELSDFFKVKGWQVNIDTTPSINPIDGYQTQLKTLQINTPYIDVSDILLKKLNNGELYLGGGTATTSSISATAPFSLCATLGADFAGSFAFGNLTFSAASNVLTISDGVNSTTATLSATEAQTMVFIQNASGSTLYINGEQVATESLTFTAGTFAISGGTGTMSRIKIFNFDMSAAGALYTVSDYTAGIDESPALKDGKYYYVSDLTPAAVSTSTWEASVDAGQIKVAKKTDGGSSWNSVKLTPVAIKAGDVVDLTLSAARAYFAIESFATPHAFTSAVNYQINNSTFGTNVGVDTGVSILTGGSARIVAGQGYPNFAITGIPVSASSVENNPNGSNNFLTGDYIVFSVEVRVNGALVSLADYTLNGKILDASGNGNDATISGQVAGTHDTEIGALYKAFTGNDATVSSSGYVPTVQSFQDALRAALNSDGTAYTNTYQYEDDITVLTEWTDGEFKVLDENGDLIYWVSTQWGAQMGGDYTTNDATDLNAKIFYTCPENEVNGIGKGREWIEYIHNDVSARTIYEHAQGITGSPTPTIGGIIIQPNFSGTTVGGTSIQSIFGKNVLDAPSGYQFIYLKASPTNLEKTKTAYPIWRTIRPIPVQGGN